MSDRGFRQSVSRYVSRFENVVVDAVADGKDYLHRITIIITTLSFQKTTLRLDARHRATNTFSITIVNSDTGKDTTWNWRPDGARGAVRRDSWTWRMIRTIDHQNVSRDRLNKIQYSDHVKSQYSVILRLISRSWIYFIKQKLQRIIQTNHLFFLTNVELNHMHTRAVLIPVIKLSAVIKLTRQSDYNISFVQIPVVLVKWHEKTFPFISTSLYIYIYIYSSDATLTWQSTKKKIRQRSWPRSFDSRKSVKDM